MKSFAALSRSQARSVQDVQMGIVDSVREVNLEGIKSNVGVRLDSGRMLAITQAADEEFRPGDRVRILSGDGTTRVTH